MSEKLWDNVAKRFMKAGNLPFTINDTIIDILKMVITEEQARFLVLLRKSSYNLEQLKSLTDMGDETLTKMIKDLNHSGALTAIPSISTGVMVYRIVPFFPGMLEFTLMRGETNENTKKIARLWQKFFDETVKLTQTNYDLVVKSLKDRRPIDRVVPVEQEIEVQQEKIIPLEEMSRIIEENDPIALTTCYCRHQKDLIGDPCKTTDLRKNCFGFGRAAEFLIRENFGEKISKEDALRIMKESEDAGLVHKAFHNGLDPAKEIEGICQCCKCCCGTFASHYAGAAPFLSQTSYLAKINEENCVACGTCVEKCNAEAIELEDIAVVDEERCIGCGLCAYHCPENAIEMVRTGPRKVFVPPPKLETY